MKKYFTAKTAKDLQILGEILAQKSSVALHIYFSGDLGVGKTTLVRGFLRGLGYTSLVKSPTYTLVESYIIAQSTIHHFDLYRLQDSLELENIGIRDYFTKETFCLLEWPERAAAILPKPDWFINIMNNNGERHIMIESITPRGKQILRTIDS